MRKLWGCAAALCLLALPGCGCGGDIEADLVFINDSDAAIVEVVVECQDRGGGTRNADSSPLKRGESFGFETGEYPVTVYVYGEPFTDFRQKELASLTLEEALPPEGCWYVTARDGERGLELSAVYEEEPRRGWEA